MGIKLSENCSSENFNNPQVSSKNSFFLTDWVTVQFHKIFTPPLLPYRRDWKFQEGGGQGTHRSNKLN